MSFLERKTFNPLMGSKFIEAMTDAGLIPQGCTRIVVDSGQPGGLVTIYWSAFGQEGLVDPLIEALRTELMPTHEEFLARKDS